MPAPHAPERYSTLQLYTVMGILDQSCPSVYAPPLVERLNWFLTPLFGAPG